MGSVLRRQTLLIGSNGWRFRVKEGGVTSRVYQAVLEEHLPTVLDADSIFMQDNVPIHTAHRIRNWLNSNNITVLDWPPYSPDLNPIECLWFLLKENTNMEAPELLYLRGSKDMIREVLSEAIEAGWEAIRQERMNALIESMPRRIAAAIEAEGWYTKY